MSIPLRMTALEQWIGNISFHKEALNVVEGPWSHKSSVLIGL